MPSDENGAGPQDILLEIRNLKTHFALDEGTVRAVDGVDLEVRRGQVVGVVGESGRFRLTYGFVALRYRFVI